MKRKVGYKWRLREVMAQHQMFTATELVPLLRDRGIDLSASQVHRLVTGTPERLSLQVLAALCDILGCTPAELIATTAENAGVRKTATGDLPAPPRPSRSSGPARPASCPTHEPRLHHRRAVRTLAQDRVRPLRRARLVRRPLAGRTRLPDLLTTGPSGHGAPAPAAAADRALPGLRPGDGTPICTGLRRLLRCPIACSRCGHEGKLHGGRLCTRCTLTDRLTELLDDGTGRVRPELVPLPTCCAPWTAPLSGLAWLTRAGQPDSRRRTCCRGLGPGRDPAHPRGIPRPPALAGRRPPARTAHGLRRPARRRQADPARFERWLRRPPRRHRRPDHAQLDPPVRDLARPAPAAGPRRDAADHPGRPSDDRRRAGQPGDRLPRLARRARPHPRRPAARPTSTPGTPSTPSTPASTCEPSCTGACGQPAHPTLPAAPASRSAARRRCPQHERTRRCSAASSPTHDLPLRTRVAAVIVLLYAQPVSRIVRLTIDDVDPRRRPDRCSGSANPPSPVPEPVADLLLELDQRAGTT